MRQALPQGDGDSGLDAVRNFDGGGVGGGGLQRGGQHRIDVSHQDIQERRACAPDCGLGEHGLDAIHRQTGHVDRVAAAARVVATLVREDGIAAARVDAARLATMVRRGAGNHGDRVAATPFHRCATLGRCRMCLAAAARIDEQQFGHFGHSDR